MKRQATDWQTVNWILIFLELWNGRNHNLCKININSNNCIPSIWHIDDVLTFFLRFFHERGSRRHLFLVRRKTFFLLKMEMKWFDIFPLHFLSFPFFLLSFFAIIRTQADPPADPSYPRLLSLSGFPNQISIWISDSPFNFTSFPFQLKQKEILHRLSVFSSLLPPPPPLPPLLPPRYFPVLSWMTINEWIFPKLSPSRRPTSLPPSLWKCVLLKGKWKTKKVPFLFVSTN